MKLSDEFFVPSFCLRGGGRQWYMRWSYFKNFPMRLLSLSPGFSYFRPPSTHAYVFVPPSSMGLHQKIIAQITIKEKNITPPENITIF